MSETASRALACVGMSRGRDSNHAYIYPRSDGPADQENTVPADASTLHLIQRGTKYSAADYFRMILAHDERPRTLHAEAARNDRALLADIVQQLLNRQEQRRAARGHLWRQHNAHARARQAAYERIGNAAERTAERGRGLNVDGLEL